MRGSSEKLKELFEFGAKVGKLPHVRAVVLFGSVARGEATLDSDIDVATIYTRKNEALMKKVEKLAPERVHVVHVEIKELLENVPLAGALSGEGLILFGRPITFEAKKLKLRPMVIIAYDTSDLNQNTRNRLNRTLYGGTSTVGRGRKRYVQEYKGLTTQLGITKIGRAVLMVTREKVPAITGALEKHGSRWKEIPVWVY